MSNVVLSLLYAVALYAAFIAGFTYGGRPAGDPRRALRPRPWLTLAVLAITGLGNLAQFVHHGTLALLERDASALTAGQWWRLVTPLLVQDGGVAGAIFNLLALAFVGTAAERVFAGWQWALLYLGGGLAGEVVAYTLLPGQGTAGNSVANFGLAAGVLVAALASRARPAAVAGLVGILAGLVLLVAGNLHGAAFAVGGLLGVALVGTRRAPAALGGGARKGRPARW
ncbi:MAG TPA: rhomboid family intramembrane serine protease [Thermomicrobiales bacterium]|nr:rhomboid family intramembrane serine protease [Thermomicrobiales bacterium]